MGKTVVLCGFMGSGKTTVGRLLAKRLLARFLSIDELIEQRQGMPVRRIFEEKGEAYFRALEHVALQDALNQPGPSVTVVDTGGGLFEDPDNQALVREDPSAVVVYLSTDFDICYERIKDSDRPLVAKYSRDQLRALYEKRDAVYRKICATQMYNHQKPDTVADNIVTFINPLSIQKL